MSQTYSEKVCREVSHVNRLLADRQRAGACATADDMSALGAALMSGAVALMREAKGERYAVEMIYAFADGFVNGIPPEDELVAEVNNALTAANRAFVARENLRRGHAALAGIERLAAARALLRLQLWHGFDWIVSFCAMGVFWYAVLHGGG